MIVYSLQWTTTSTLQETTTTILHPLLTSTTELMAVKPESSSLHGLLQLGVVKCSYTWTVKKINFCSKTHGEYLESPPFSVKANDSKVFEGRIRMYPKGHYGEISSPSLYLQIQSWDRDIFSAKYEFSILNIKGNKVKTSGIQTARIIQPKFFNCFEKLITLQSLLDEENDLLPEDKLTIHCEVTINMERKDMSQDDEAFADLSEDICKMFKDNMTLADVTLVADGKEIQAHKFMLVARSPVFAAMFQHQMVEQKSNHVYITDIDYEVLTEMLRFMYTDRAPNLDQMAGDLLVAADKYALDSLKLVCEEALYKSISVETAAETLLLADFYSAEWLKAQTIAFINTDHATEVTETPGWLSMIPAHPHLVTEVLQAFVIQHLPHLVTQVQKHRK